MLCDYLVIQKIDFQISIWRQVLHTPLTDQHVHVIYV